MKAFVSGYFSNLSGMQRLLAFMFVVTTVSVMLAYSTGGWPLTIILGGVILAFLWLTRAIWLPEGYGREKTRRYVLWVVMVVALAIVSSRSWLQAFILPAIKTSLPDPIPKWIPETSPDHLMAAITLGAVVFVAYLVLYVGRDKTVMGRHPNDLNEEFPERDYQAKVKSFCESLRSHLRDLDTRSNWSDAYFVPLEAEVEVISGSKSRQKITDLLTALRDNRLSRICLVLGDPGSGKSVALRKLATELLDEVEQSRRVPVYVNLKEWETEQSWSQDNPPTVRELHEFVKRYLKRHTDVFGETFVNHYFDKMLEHGRFFLILDSFDEIPAVLDASESSWLIQELSSVISTFLAGADQGRGVVSSRIFRRPTLTTPSCATLEIRPFSERHIAKTLEHSVTFKESILNELFQDRPSLVPIARNPLLADLIRKYMDGHQGQLPPHQLALFDSYIQERLEAARETLDNLGLSPREVIEGAVEISWLIFNNPDPRVGLEARLSFLETGLSGVRVREIAQALYRARLARLGTIDDERFSFVHRRFNEYFVALKLIKDPDLVERGSIPTDSRWRDALVLYCEVADDHEAQKIADFCWSKIQYLASEELLIDDSRYLQGVHCLRFLADAFRGRQDCLHEFQEELATYIHNKLGQQPNLLSAKIALEATGLLNGQQTESIMVDALKIKNDWISRTALYSCRHIPKIGKELEKMVRSYLNSIPIFEFIRQFQELFFSFRLSEPFYRLKNYCKFRLFSEYFFIVSVLLLFLISPLACSFFVIITVLIWFLIILVKISLKYRYMDDMYISIELIGRVMLIVVASISIAFNVLFIYMESLAGDSIGNVIQYGAENLKMLAYVEVAELINMTDDYIIHFSMLAPIEAMNVWSLHKNILLYFFGFVILISIPIYRRYPIFVSDIRVIIILVLLGIIGGMAIYFYSTKLSNVVDKEYGSLINSVGLGLLCILMLWFMVSWTLRSIDLFKDFCLIRQYRQKVLQNRRHIADALANFRTPYFRLHYVQSLRDSNIIPDGEWPNGLPNFRNDKASSLLAQLEERWLGLNR